MITQSLDVICLTKRITSEHTCNERNDNNDSTNKIRMIILIMLPWNIYYDWVGSVLYKQGGGA